MRYFIVLFCFCLLSMFTGCAVLEWLAGSGAEDTAKALGGAGVATGNPFLIAGSVALALAGSLAKNLKDGFAIRGIVKGVGEGLDDLDEATKSEALKHISKRMPNRYKGTVKKAIKVLKKADL